MIKYTITLITILFLTGCSKEPAYDCEDAKIPTEEYIAHCPHWCHGSAWITCEKRGVVLVENPYFYSDFNWNKSILLSNITNDPDVLNIFGSPEDIHNFENYPINLTPQDDELCILNVAADFICPPGVIT